MRVYIRVTLYTYHFAWDDHILVRVTFKAEKQFPVQEDGKQEGNTS